MPTKLTVANETIQALTAKLETAYAALTRADERADTLVADRESAEQGAETLRGQLADAQMTINRLSGELETALAALKIADEEVDIQLQRIEGFKNRSNREHKRASAANVKNEELRKALRTTEFERRRLQLLIDGDVYHVRKVQVLTEQLNLVRSVVNAHLNNDEHVADVPVEELLK